MFGRYAFCELVVCGITRENLQPGGLDIQALAIGAEQHDFEPLVTTQRLPDKAVEKRCEAGFPSRSLAQ